MLGHRLFCLFEELIADGRAQTLALSEEHCFGHGGDTGTVK